MERVVSRLTARLLLRQGSVSVMYRKKRADALAAATVEHATASNENTSGAGRKLEALSTPSMSTYGNTTRTVADKAPVMMPPYRVAGIELGEVKCPICYDWLSLDNAGCRMQCCGCSLHIHCLALSAMGSCPCCARLTGKGSTPGCSLQASFRQKDAEKRRR